MKTTKYFMVALLLLTWAACKKEDYKMFTDVARELQTKNTYLTK